MITDFTVDRGELGRTVSSLNEILDGPIKDVCLKPVSLASYIGVNTAGYSHSLAC